MLPEKLKKEEQPFFNKKGRGLPDISAYASNFFIYLNGNLQRVSGTSASTPLIGAMVNSHM
jgi:hypothetical protein